MLNIIGVKADEKDIHKKSLHLGGLNQNYFQTINDRDSVPLLEPSVYSYQ